MREGQEHPLHPQLLGPSRGESGETNIGPTVGRADDLDLPPADSSRRFAALQRLVDRLLGGEPYRYVGRWVRATLAVGALGRGKQALEHARSFVGDDSGDPRDLDQIDADADRGHGLPLRSRGARRATRGRGGSRPAPVRAIPAPPREASTTRPAATATV